VTYIKQNMYLISTLMFTLYIYIHTSKFNSKFLGFIASLQH